MALPLNRNDFKEYCLRKLGYPVIDINLDDEQIEDRIDDALAFWHLYHYESLEKVVVIHELTEDDINNGYITLPTNIISVISLATVDENLYSNNFMNNLWQSMKNIMHDLGFGLYGCRGGVTEYSMTMNYLAELQFQFSVRNEINFNHATGKLLIPGRIKDIKSLEPGHPIAFEAYLNVDPENYPNVWSIPILIEYATALIGENWGVVLSKFDNVELPGGITLDGDKIYDRYHEIRQAIEEEYQLKYELPVDFFVG